MEKICTRCSFRNPNGRGVCQVCGYAKFSPMADAQLVVAKDAAGVVNDTVSMSEESFAYALQQTKVAVVNAVRKIAALVTDRPVHVTEERQPIRVVSDSTKYSSESTFEGFENNDLDSMLAWFKSYGVDRPLILDTPSAPVVVRQNRAA